MFRRIQSLRSPPVRSLSTRYAVRRFFSEKATERTGKDRWEDVPSDPRPPWVYSTSAALRLVLIPSAYSFYWPIRRICLTIWKAFYFMPCFSRTSVIGSTSSCPYVVAALPLRNISLIVMLATKMAAETTGCVLYYHARGKKVD